MTEPNDALLHIERDGTLATVWLNRAEVHNAFDEALIHALTEAFLTLEADDAVRVVVLAGRGRSFSAGADLGWMRRQGAADVADNEADAMQLATLFSTIARCRKPTVARVHGAALAGGTGLVAACDIAVASDRAQFGLSEVRLGLIPATIAPYLVRAMGERQAQRWCLTGERFDAATAHRLGLVQEVVPEAELDAKVAAVVGALLQGAPGALAACKDLLQAVGEQPLDDLLIADTAHRIALRRATAEAREGLAAFLGKRAPGWVQAP